MTGIMEIEPGALAAIGESLDRGSQQLHRHIDVAVPTDMPGARALERGREAFRDRLQDHFDWAKWMADECRSSANDFINTDFAVSEEVRLTYMPTLFDTYVHRDPDVLGGAQPLFPQPLPLLPRSGQEG